MGSMSRTAMNRIGPAWIPFALVVICAVALGWMWWFADNDRQTNVLLTIALVGGTGILEVLWLLFLSGFRWRSRLAVTGTIALTCAVGAGLTEIEGVTGDIVPILGWRWSAGTDESLSQEIPDIPRVEARPVERVSWDKYPQFLGRDRNGSVKWVKLARDWKNRPPKEIWRHRVGPGWSGFAVAGDAAFTQEQRGESEIVTCYDLRTGEIRWGHSDRARYATTLGGVGPRATPTVTDARVFTLGATGILNCLERSTGELVWGKNVVKENGAKVKEWGMSGSPLIHKNLVIVSAGGKDDRSLVAYERRSGELVWHGGTDSAGYSSPLFTTLAGLPQILIFNRRSVVGHDPSSGAVLWREPWKGEQQIAQPVPLPGDRVMVSAGYGAGCALYEIGKDDAGGLRSTQVWKTRSLRAKFANFVHRDGFVYGLDDGILVCVDVASGKRRWKRGRYGHGQMILVGDLLIVMAESGEVVLLEPVPEELRELARFEALSGKTWNSPALAAPYLLVRNDKEAACYELPLADR